MKAALERGIRIRVLVSDPNSDLMNEIENVVDSKYSAAYNRASRDARKAAGRIGKPEGQSGNQGICTSGFQHIL
jgi:hypothetical protein